MAFAVDDIKKVVQRARNAFRAELPSTDADLWPNNIVVSAKVMGGAVWGIYGKIARIDKERFVMTASDEGLNRHGADYGMARKSPSHATGKVIVQMAYPNIVPAYTTFTRSDGASFTSTTAANVSGTGVAIVTVLADVVGKNGNTLSDTPLATSLNGVTSAVVGELGLGQGTDGETKEQYRQRLLERKRNPPHGGNRADYVRWAKEIPGVTRVFVGSNFFGSGTVAVWFLMDDTYPNGIPQPIDVATVQAHLEDMAPAGIWAVHALAPVPLCVDVVVSGLSPDTESVRVAINGELQALFRNMGTVGTGEDGAFIMYKQWIRQAISNAPGEYKHNLVAPADDLSFGPGILPCLQSVSFVP